MKLTKIIATSFKMYVGITIGFSLGKVVTNLLSKGLKTVNDKLEATIENSEEEGDGEEKS